MAKSYTEQLTEWVGRRNRLARRDRNRVAFLAVKDDVREALDQGWPVKTIWTHMHEQQRIGFGYDTFLGYVRRHVRGPAEPQVARGSDRLQARSLAPEHLSPGRLTESSTPGNTGKESHGQAQISGFTFNAAPNREELI